MHCIIYNKINSRSDAPLSRCKFQNYFESNMEEIMFECNLKYGSTSKKFVFRDEKKVSVIKSHEKPSSLSEDEIISNALSNPEDSKTLKNIVKREETVCIIIPDTTRLWQKPFLYLPHIVKELNQAGVPDNNIHFLCALGSHRKQTEEEHKLLLGDELYKRFHVTDHNCKDKNNLQYLGTTSFGTPVSVNKLALSCDHIVLTGGIVFHDMAGFGGGRKSILPGISSYETIMANHSLCLSPSGRGSNPCVKSAALKGNPFNEDMMEACEFVKPSFLFNVITNSKGDISGAVSGNYITAHKKGCRMLKETDGIEIHKKADLVIASCGGYPKDIDLYQASKTLTNAREAAKKGGTIIILAECIEGLGHPEMEFIINEFKNNAERGAELRKNYTIAKYTGYLICEIAENYNVIFVSAISKNKLKNCGIKIADSLQSAKELSICQEECSLVYVMPNGGNTLPIEK